MPLPKSSRLLRPLGLASIGIATLAGCDVVANSREAGILLGFFAGTIVIVAVLGWVITTGLPEAFAWVRDLIGWVLDNAVEWFAALPTLTQITLIAFAIALTYLLSKIL